MSPVWCHFGGPGGAAVLGLLSAPAGGTQRPAVSGGAHPHRAGAHRWRPALRAPRWVQPADLGVEAVTSIYVSMGVSSSQYLKSFPTGGTPHG